MNIVMLRLYYYIFILTLFGLHANAEIKHSDFWATGTSVGVSLQWNIPQGYLLPSYYTVLRSANGKKRYTQIGKVYRLQNREWFSIVLPGNRDTLTSLIQTASNEVIEHPQQQSAITTLNHLAAMTPEPYLLIMGLSFSDTTCRQNVSYDYILLADNKKVAELTNIIGFKRTPPRTPVQTFAKELDGSVKFTWSIRGNRTAGIRGYNIYKVNQNTKLPNKINNSLITTILLDEDAYNYSFFEDIGLENNRLYLYYITSVDVFGYESAFSEAISAIPQKTQILIAPTIKSVTNFNENVQLEWEKSQDNRVQGYNVYRSIVGSGLKFKLNKYPLPNYTTSYTDSPGDLPTNFITYSLTVIDKKGQESRTSFDYETPIPDSKSPNLTGFFQCQQTDGKVRLWWTKSTDADINGYELARSYEQYAKYSIISPTVILDSMFVDILPTNSNATNMWYRLRAVDRHGNVSQWSQPLPTYSHSILNIQPPEGLTAVGNRKTVELTWQPSTSTNGLGYYINRYSDTTLTPITLNLNPLNWIENSFIDRTIAEGKTYWYEIVSIDSNYILSPPSNRVVVLCGDKFSLRAPYIDTLATTSQGVFITWKWRIHDIPFGELIIERSSDGEHYYPISSLIPTSQNKYTDVSANKGERYYYRLRFKAVTGIVSEPSSPELSKAIN